MRLRIFKRSSPTKAAFTYIEVMVASAIALVLTAGTAKFVILSTVSFSGIAAQSAVNAKAGGMIEFIQSRARLATMVSNDVAGNALTLAFDDNAAVDSDGDGKAYNDQNHFERFQFQGINSTNPTACITNKMIYIPNTSSTSNRVLVSSGLRNLPGFKIFTVTNVSTVIIRFGVVDPYAGDNYQAIDIQAMSIPLNRPSRTNLVAIIP